MSPMKKLPIFLTLIFLIESFLINDLNDNKKVNNLDERNSSIAENKLRILQNISGCYNYNKTTDKCMKCVDGYALMNFQCIACNSGCKRCTTTNGESIACVEYESSKSFILMISLGIGIPFLLIVAVIVYYSCFKK